MRMLRIPHTPSIVTFRSLCQDETLVHDLSMTRLPQFLPLLACASVPARDLSPNPRNLQYFSKTTTLIEVQKSQWYYEFLIIIFDAWLTRWVFHVHPGHPVEDPMQKISEKSNEAGWPRWRKRPQYIHNPSWLSSRTDSQYSCIVGWDACTGVCWVTSTDDVTTVT